MAVLVQLTREGEESAGILGRERHNFAASFEKIENHAEVGLYTILCRLYKVLYELDFEVISKEKEAEVSSINFEAYNVTNNERIIRDYIVLIALENSTDQLILRFDRLAKVRRERYRF